MESLQLIQQLYHPEAGMRRQAALVIGTVEETGALVALQQRAREETDENIRKVVRWAGKRVQQAEANGFSTIDAIFDYFKIDREIQSGIDPEEAELLRHHSDVAGGISQSSVFSFGSMLTADEIKTGHLGQRNLDKKAMLRLPALQPSDTDIQMKIKQLTNSTDPRRQKNAALALREINNPDALPYLALVFYRNENPQNQDIVEKSTKALYWSVNYYAMDSKGLLNLEIAKRRREGGYDKVVTQSRRPQPEPAKQVSVTDILSSAQAKKRKKRKR